MKPIAKINWEYPARKIYGKDFTLGFEEWNQLAAHLATDKYYIILTHRSTHLSTYAVSLANWIKTGKWSYWSHALANCEGDLQKLEYTIMSSKFLQENFRFVEATAKGVHYSKFFDVFCVDGVALLEIPKAIADQMDDYLTSNIGKEYDNLFDFKKDNNLCCTEVIWDAINDAQVENCFPHLEAALKAEGALTPEMFYEAAQKGDMKIAYEVRKKFAKPNRSKN